MSFAEDTGRTRIEKCGVCGLNVAHEEVRHLSAPRDFFTWNAVMHRAPCGAHCSGGGYHHGETDVHVPPFGSCPRCGVTESEVVKVIDKPDGLERVVIHRYTPDYLKYLGHRIDLEIRNNDEWQVKLRWHTKQPGSNKKVLELARNYVDWVVVVS